MKSPTPKKFLIASLFFAILLTTLYSLVTNLTFAFNPPTGSGGIGGGAIGVDVYNNIAIGTSTSGLDSKVLIYATSTNSFFLKVVSPTASPILVVTNDGKVGIATSTPTSTLTVQGDLTVTGIIYGIINGQLNGTVSAANVSAEVFGKNTGGGNYSFPVGGSLGVGTSTTVGLPQQLSVYGGAYVSGSVGIGMSSPVYKLDVSGGARVTDLRIATTSAQAGYVWKATDTQGNGAWQIDATGLAGGQTNYIPIWTSATTQGTSTIYQSPLGPTGSIGIGTITPNNLLQVKDLISFNNTDFNTQIGYQAGRNIVSGAQYNTFLGYQAGFSSSGGSTNVADYNTAIGYRSLFSNTTGDSNTANGYNALYSNTTGYNNTAIGYRSFFSNTTGNFNTANGVQALFSNTGDYNTANGYNALYYNTTGTYNTANGTQALSSNTTGYNNTANGVQALYSNTTGYNNTANGYKALYDFNALDGTGNNTAIGYNTGRGIVTGINNTILGANVTGLSSTLSNNIIIADGAGNRRINVDNTGNVGIGTTNPLYRLTVTDGSAPELSDAGIAAPAVISVQGDGRAYFMGRDVTNNIEFLFGTSVAGEVFAGAMTAHDMSLRTNNINRLTVKATTGNVGLSSLSPGSKLTVAGGDVFVASSTSGIILKAPDGHCARVQLSNSNTLTVTTVACPGS